MTRLFKFSDNNSEKQIGNHTEPVTEQNVNRKKAAGLRYTEFKAVCPAQLGERRQESEKRNNKKQMKGGGD